MRVIKDLSPFKRCTSCKLPKPLNDFHLHRGAKGSRDGHRSRCKACETAKVKEYQALNRAAVRKATRTYDASHRRERAAAARANYMLHAEERRAYSRAYYATHLASIRRAAQVYAKINREQMRHREKRRRALKANAPINDFTLQQWHLLQELYQHRCAYCGKRTKGRLTKDHIIPLTRGGAHTASNIVPACTSCNSSKGNRGVLNPIQPFMLDLVGVSIHMDASSTARPDGKTTARNGDKSGQSNVLAMAQNPSELSWR